MDKNNWARILVQVTIYRRLRIGRDWDKTMGQYIANHDSMHITTTCRTDYFEINNWISYGPTRAEISGDIQAMKKTCSGGDGRRCRTCRSTRKHTPDVLTNLRGTFGGSNHRHFDEYSAMHQEDSGINRRYS